MPLAKQRCFLPLLCGCVVFLAAIEIITVAMSLASLAISFWTANTILLIAAAAGYMQWRIMCGHDNIATLSDWNNGKKPVQILLLSLTVISAAVFIFLWISAYIRPDLTCDGNAYHIPTVQLWTQNGGVCWVDHNFECSKFMNGYPKGVELIACIFVRAFGNSHFVNMANLLFLSLGVLGICAIARLLGANRITAMACGAAFILLPVNINQSATTYVDSSYASCAIAFIALLLYTHAAIETSPAVPWRLIFAFGGAAGLAMSAKSTGIVLVAVGMAISAVFLTSRIAMLRRMAVAIVAALLMIIITGGYWYIRNYYYAGNPLYPVEVRLGGHAISPGLPIEQIISVHANTPSIMHGWPEPLKVLCAWLQCFWDWPETIMEADSRMGGLGFLWIVGCVPAIILVLWTSIRDFKKNRVCRLVILLFLIVAATFLLTPMKWWARYTLWIYALGLPCLAIAADKMISKTACKIWLLFCVAALMLDAGVCVYDAARDTKLPPKLAFAELNGTVFDEIFAGDSAVAVGPLVGQLPDGRWKQEIVGRLSLPIGRRKIYAVPRDATFEHTKELALQNVRWLIWDDTLPLPPFAATAVNKANVSGYIVLQLAK